MCPWVLIISLAGLGLLMSMSHRWSTRTQGGKPPAISQTAAGSTECQSSSRWVSF